MGIFYALKRWPLEAIREFIVTHVSRVEQTLPDVTTFLAWFENVSTVCFLLMSPV